MIRFEQRQPGMENERMNFLNSRRYVARHDQLVIRETLRSAAILAENGNGLELAGLRGMECSDDVRRPAAGAEDHEDVAFAPQSFDLAGKNLVETKVVRDACQQRCVGTKSDGGEGEAVFVETADEFLGKVEGVSGAASVARGEQFVTVRDGGPNRFAGRVDRWQQGTASLQSRDQVFKGGVSNGDKSWSCQ